MFTSDCNLSESLAHRAAMMVAPVASVALVLILAAGLFI